MCLPLQISEYLSDIRPNAVVIGQLATNYLHISMPLASLQSHVTSFYHACPTSKCKVCPNSLSNDFTMSTSLASAAPVENRAARYFHAQIATAKGNCSRRWKSVLGNSSKRFFCNTQCQQAETVRNESSDGDAERGFTLVRVRKLVVKKEEAITSSQNAGNEGDYEEFPPKACEDSLFSTLPEVCDGVRMVEGYSDLPEVVEPVLLEASTTTRSPVVKKRDYAARYFTSKWDGIRKVGASDQASGTIELKTTLENLEAQLTPEQVVTYEKRALLQDLTNPQSECWSLPLYSKH
jgi:hypothetical protein